MLEKDQHIKSKRVEHEISLKKNVTPKFSIKSQKRLSTGIEHNL